MARNPDDRRSALARLLNVDSRELPAVLAGLLLFFLLFTGYFMLRPVRETMGVAGGVDNLQWLFSATFVATLVVLPLFGWVASRVARNRILPWTYTFFVVNLLAFAAGFIARPESVWAGRIFYVWLSVFKSGYRYSICSPFPWPGACWPMCSKAIRPSGFSH